MGDTLHSILIRLVAYLAVAIAAGLLFLAGATVYALMWPKPVVPLSQMSGSQGGCELISVETRAIPSSGG
jgi:hypothetical protein